ncbi:FKBP-type peptidyl-prolyl cis-trans isomerase [Halorarius halobius]|uniref:FKBP-type peptidyl-prolyl cis-trans isomerase n=1 Tax=Halorarius halobius TaxID=2962671 RepID=UPI0020CB9424|nr:FKBP-type peptidyl-prolyl cis-trans isomerase [Halorarius halobius]
MAVADGDTAVVHYVVRLADGGPVVDTTDVDVALETGVYHDHCDYQPLSFEVGAGEVPSVIDEAVRGMARGEERTVAVAADEAVGPRSEARVVEVPRGDLETRSGRDARPWRLVGTDTGEVGWITDVDDDTVTVDFNHDLAGERLAVELRLLDVRERDGGSGS